MSSNVSGNSNLIDLQALVSNLQSSINNISSAFNTVQTNISNLNIYDTNNTQKINQINTTDGLQEQEITQLEQENITDDNRLDILELKFPITDAQVLDNTINILKIKDLTSNLTTINNNITIVNNRVSDLNTLEQNDINLLTTNLNIQVTKEANDISLINYNFNNLISSVPGSQNTFQQQIDVLKSSQLTDEGDISTAKSNISNLQGDNVSNKNRLGILESDNSVNKSNISSLQSGLTTANQNITTNTSTISTLNTNLSSQISKEATDVANLQSQINSLSSSSTNGNNSLQSQITVLSNKEQTDFNDLQAQITTNKNIEIADKSELNTKISDNLTTETTHYNTVNTALNNLTIKENSDFTTLQSNLTTYQGSNNSRLNIDETDISNLKTNVNTNNLDISSLKTDNTTTKTNVSTLQSKVSFLESDNLQNKFDIVQHSTYINTINYKLNQDEDELHIATADIYNMKIYDTQNTNNINTINLTLTTHTTDINTLKNTTIVNLDNKFLIKNDPLITENILGKLKCDNLDSINSTLNIGQSAININIGSTNNNDAKVINIGGVNDTVNILGSLNNIETTNTKITDKLITLNKGSVGNNQASLVGFQLRDNDDDNKGYITTNSLGNEFILKPPQNDNEYKIGNVDTFTSLTTKLYVDLQTSALQSSINGLINTTTELNNEITILNTTQLDNIPFSKINAYPSTNNYAILGNGSISKINNNVIDNNTINPNKLIGCSGDATLYLAGDGLFKNMPTANFNSSIKVVNSNFDDNTINISKLIYPNDGGKYLSGDGTFKTISSSSGGSSSFNNSFSGNVNANNYKITNLSNGVDVNDGVNKSQLDIQSTNLTSYVDNKYLNFINASISSTIPPAGSLGTPQLYNKLLVNARLDVNNNNIINCGLPNDPHDVVNKEYIDNVIPTSINSLSCNNDYSLSSNKLINVADPVNGQDVVTKNFLNNNVFSLYNNNRIKGTTNYVSYTYIGNLLTGPLNVIISLVENGNVGYDLYNFRNIYISSNYADNWSNYRNYIQCSGFNNSNIVSLSNLYEYSGISNYYILYFVYGQVYLKVNSPIYTIKYFVQYQF